MFTKIENPIVRLVILGFIWANLINGIGVFGNFFTAFIIF